MSIQGKPAEPPDLPKHVPRMAWSIRWLGLLAGLFVIALLVTASRLSPSPDGLGTHQQLGLPPCTSVVMFGSRCPACGMTTSWAHMMRGDLPAAFQANVGGLMLAIIGMAYIPSSCYFFFSGKPTRGEWFSMTLAILLMAAMGAATLQWVIRIGFG